MPRTRAHRSLADLLARLVASDYEFVTPTSGTHRLVRDRSPASADDVLRDVFGWSRPFRPDLLPKDVSRLAEAAGVLTRSCGAARATIRVSTVNGLPFIHSAPSADPDAVFLGPDSYRYACFLRQSAGAERGVSVALDIGVGAGVGAATLALLYPAARVIGSDINRKALEFAQANLEHARLRVDLVECSGLPSEPALFDLIAANPPYIAGAGQRTYRDGGDELGAALALSWVRAGVARLAPGGRLLLYTGSAIVRGRDAVRDALELIAAEADLSLAYEEIDPDVFGGTLRQAAYRDVERIAAVGAVLTDRRGGGPV